MAKCKITPIEKLIQFKNYLEEKSAYYGKQISHFQRLYTDAPNGELREVYKKDLNYWTQLKNEAETALVFVKAQIAFEED